MLPYGADLLLDLTAELDAWRERLDRRGLLPRAWLGRLRRDLEVEAVAASTSMEGVPVTVDEVRRILAGRPREVKGEDAALVEGYRDAMSFVLRRADASAFGWDAELIIALHDRILAGSWAAGAGRFRDGPTYVVNSETHEVVFEPPDADRVPELVDLACSASSAAPSIPRPTSRPSCAPTRPRSSSRCVRWICESAPSARSGSPWSRQSPMLSSSRV